LAWYHTFTTVLNSISARYDAFSIQGLATLILDTMFCTPVHNRVTGIRYTCIVVYLWICIKYQGKLEIFNGMDILQAKHYIKMHCGTYLWKALGNHTYLLENAKSKTYPVPYLANLAYTTQQDTAVPPTSETDQAKFHKEMNINY
jgi:hypothetical protein